MPLLLIINDRFDTENLLCVKTSRRRDEVNLTRFSLALQVSERNLMHAELSGMTSQSIL